MSRFTAKVVQNNVQVVKEKSFNDGEAENARSEKPKRMKPSFIAIDAQAADILFGIIQKALIRRSRVSDCANWLHSFGC